MTALLSVSGLQVNAGPRTLVRSVDFTLEAGKTLGIVGESGSGKTLTARAVLAALPQGVTAGGRIEFDGVSLVGRKERDLRPLRGTRLSMVLQDPFTALNPLQTVGEHIRESLAPQVRRDRAAARAETDRRLAEVGLDAAEVAGKYPFQLSGGMRQRVAIAAALAGDPDLLVADEPTTALDATTQADILRLLRQLQDDRGMALILITHDLRVAFSVCDRVMVMYAGSVVEDAPSQALTAVPRHPYTFGLLKAEPPVTHVVETLTFIPGTVPRADEVAEQCAFAARCEWHRPECSAARPPLAPVDDGRLSACIRLGEIGTDLQLREAIPAAVRTPATATGAPILTVSDLGMTYRTTSLVARAKQKQAVRNVSFDIAEGESLGLLGETGSGKTSIARCLLGLQRATSGTMHLGGLDISDRRRLTGAQRREASRLVQAVFQDPYASLNPMLTIGAALKEALAAGGSDQTVEELLDMVGLPASHAARKPSALSGGQRQRVAIARALAVRPRLLICDEPVAALDVSVQAQVLELLRQIRRDHGTSMLFITHDLSVVRQMADRVIVLRGGEIVESGTTKSVLDTPAHPYTISLVESVPGTAVARS